MNKNPLISITLITHNSQSVLRKTLTHIFDIHYDNFEVLIVDNNSTDGTLGLVEDEFPQTRLIKLPRNLGILARNVCFANAKGEIIFVFDDDSYPKTSDTIKKTVEYFKEDEGVGVVACLIEGGIFDNKSTSPGKNCTMFYGCGSAIKREVLDETGFYDEDFFHYGNESDLAIRILNAGYLISHYKDICVIHERITKKNEWPMLFLSARNQIRILMKYFPVSWWPLLFFRCWFWMSWWGYCNFGFKGLLYRQAGLISGIIFFYPAMKKRMRIKEEVLISYVKQRESLRSIF